MSYQNPNLTISFSANYEQITIVMEKIKFLKPFLQQKNSEQNFTETFKMGKN